MSIFYAGFGPMSKTKLGLLVVDAHALAYRAHFALQQTDLTDPVTGQPTGALFGFFRMLFKILLERKPEMTAIVWDAPGRTFRDGLYTEYKANRSPMPDELRGQIEEIKALCAQCAFASLEVPGFEADDLIGTLAFRFGRRKKVLLLSSDKDCYQLLSDRVSMLRGRRGVTDFVVIDPAWVEQEIGVTCAQIPDYMGLVGDSSDNIPGARGIGPKTAAQLIQQFGSIEGIYERIEEVASRSTRTKLLESKENVLVSRRLATIDTDVPELRELTEAALLTPDFTVESVALLFRKRGFQQIYQDLTKARSSRRTAKLPAGQAAGADVGRGVGTWSAAGDDAGDEGDAVEEGETGDGPGGRTSRGGSVGPIGRSGAANGDYQLVNTKEALESLVERLAQAERLAVDTETDSEEPMRARLVGVALAAEPGKGYYVPIAVADAPYAQQSLPLDVAGPILARLLRAARPAKVGQNLKYDLLVLRRHDIELAGAEFDTMIASYLCNPGVRRHNLDDMALDHLGLSTIRYDDIVGTGRNRVTLAEIPPEAVRDYAGEDADLTLRLRGVLAEKLEKLQLDHVFREIELPLVPVLAGMEEAGMSIDAAYFEGLSKQYERSVQGLESRIHHLAKGEFNINSTKELQQILFSELGLPHGKKTKTGYSTDQNVLEGLRGVHPIVDALLDHRRLVKLKGTYIDVLPGLVNPQTGRIHTSFNQTIAATGRLSSNEPNLQNIPIREEEGRAIRRGFVAGEGRTLLSLDYSQVELRLMAHYSQDEGLISAFAEDLDVHARTASSLFGVFEQMVTPEMRSKAKVVNFSIIYGVTEFGLARSLSISRPEARDYIARFFERYPGVRRYMDDTILRARETGFVQTLSGRIRQIPEIASSNRFRREGAERTAVNTPIQGTSADIIKLAMIQIEGELRRRKLASRMVLQVHDELVFDVEPDEKDEVLEVARSGMEGAMELRVPLKVDFGFGQNWADCKG